MVAAKTGPIRLRGKAPRAQGKWKQVLEVCEEVFVHNPWDVAAARDAAEAAEHLEYLPLAQWLLESVQAQATEAEFFRHLARVEEANAAWPRAIQAWERVRKLDPTDEVGQPQDQRAVGQRHDPARGSHRRDRQAQRGRRRRPPPRPPRPSSRRWRWPSSAPRNGSRRRSRTIPSTSGPTSSSPRSSRGETSSRTPRRSSPAA